MKNPVKLVTVLIFVCLATAVWAEVPAIEAVEAGVDEPGAEAINLSGNWLLNKELSQDMASIMKSAMGAGGRGGLSAGGRGGGGSGGGRGGGMGGGRGGGGGQRPGGDSSGDMAKIQERGLRMQKEYSRLEIFHDGTELNITNGLDISQLYFTDGRETSIWTERGEMKARTGWEGRGLCIRTSATKSERQGPGRMRTFSLSEDGSQLILVEERPLPGKKEPVTVRLVYDRAN